MATLPGSKTHRSSSEWQGHSAVICSTLKHFCLTVHVVSRFKAQERLDPLVSGSKLLDLGGFHGASTMSMNVINRLRWAEFVQSNNR
jgi:hypothetical protein